MSLFRHVLFFESLDSTSTFIKQNYNELMNYTVVMTSYQTEGRGQFDRHWESEKGKNLLFSVLFKDKISTEKVNDAYIQSMKKLLCAYNVTCWYKEPNDIYVYENKISGILMETKYHGDRREYLVVGIGINVNQQYFLTNHSMSISLLTGVTYDIKKMFTEFLNYFEEFLT